MISSGFSLTSNLKISKSQCNPIKYLEKIAEGGVANIFLAKSFDVTGQEKYLICKSAKPSCKSEFLASIGREIYFAERIRHPNILDIFERRSVDGDDCLVMEYMDGQNFHKLLQNCTNAGQCVPYNLAIYAIGQAALGLHAAHEMTDESGNRLDTVHRDISPENILFSMDGDIKISDFGIAITNQMPDPAEIEGKFNYMSPEQAWGDRPDRRSDTFSLAAVLYEAVTGNKFNPHDDPNIAIQTAQFGLFTPPHELVKDFPEDLEQIILKSLDLDKNLRFNSSLDFKEALDSCASNHHWYADRHLWLGYLQAQFGFPTRLLPRMNRENYPFSNVHHGIRELPNRQIQNQQFDTNPPCLVDKPKTDSSQFVQREIMNPEDIDRTEALPAPSLEMLEALEKEMQNKGSVLDDVFNTIEAEHLLAKMQKEKPKKSALDDIFNSIDAEKEKEAKLQSQSQSQPIQKESSFDRKESSFNKKESSFNKKESSFNESLRTRRPSGPKVFQPSMHTPAVPSASSMATNISMKAHDSASIALAEFLKLEEEENNRKSAQGRMNPAPVGASLVSPNSKIENDNTQDSSSAAFEEFLQMEQKSTRQPQDSASIAFEEFLRLEQETNKRPQDSASIAFEEFLRMEQETNNPPNNPPRDTASAAFEEFLKMEQETNNLPQDTASAALEKFLKSDHENTSLPQDSASLAFEEFLKMEQEANQVRVDSSLAPLDDSLRRKQLSETSPAIDQFMDDVGDYGDDSFDEEDASCKTDVLASPFDENGNLILGEFPLPPYNNFGPGVNAPSSTAVLKLENAITSSNPIVQDEPTAAQLVANIVSGAEPIVHSEPTVAEGAASVPFVSQQVGDQSFDAPEDDIPTTSGKAFTPQPKQPQELDPDFESAPTINGNTEKPNKNIEKASGISVPTIILIVLAIVAALTACYLVYKLILN